MSKAGSYPPLEPITQGLPLGVTTRSYPSLYGNPPPLASVNQFTRVLNWLGTGHLVWTIVLSLVTDLPFRYALACRTILIGGRYQLI